MDGLSPQKWKMILIKYQRLLDQEKKKDTNQCGTIEIVNTSDHGSISLWRTMMMKIAAPRPFYDYCVDLALPIPNYHYFCISSKLGK